MNIFEICQEFSRLFFLILLPIIIVISAAGVVAGLFQLVTGIKDISFNIILKFIAIILLVYFYLPTLLIELIDLYIKSLS